METAQGLLHLVTIGVSLPTFCWRGLVPPRRGSIHSGE
jgi:hypothetical protein